MRFLVRKRRSAPAVIIVALIDVLVVLVIFLMVTTTFKQQPALKLALPTSAQSRQSGAEEKPPFIVSIDEKGTYYAGLDKIPMTVAQIRSQLIGAAERNPDLKLAVRADKKAPWESVVRVMDMAKEAKVSALSAFTQDAPAR